MYILYIHSITDVKAIIVQGGLIEDFRYYRTQQNMYISYIHSIADVKAIIVR